MGKVGIYLKKCVILLLVRLKVKIIILRESPILIASKGKNLLVRGHRTKFEVFYESVLAKQTDLDYYYLYLS